MERIKFATVWLGGCAGCHMSFLDLDEALIDLAGLIEIVYSPIVDTKEYPHGVDVCLVEGAVCNEENLELLREIRERTRVLVSLGDCSITGNVPAIRNQLGADSTAEVLQCAYIDNALENRRVPSPNGILPALLPRVIPVHEAVAVDHFLPGCPPEPSTIKAFLTGLLDGGAPRLEGRQIKFG